MAIVAADWTVTRSSGNIRYIGDDHGGASPSYATVLELHRWLQDLADDASSSGDDEMDITDENPSSRSTDNIITLLGNYNIDDTAAEHLYDGSIIQGGASTTIYDGIVNFGDSAVQIQIHQNGAVLADDWWNYGGGGLNADATAGISHRFMIKVRSAGTDIDGRRLIGTSRSWGYSYSEFKINGTARGNNVLALTQASDLNNTTTTTTVATWSDITNVTAGYANIDVDNDGSDEYFYSEWNKGSKTINQLYEYAKYVTRDGSAETLYGISGELFRGITHQVPVQSSSQSVTDFSATETVSWSGGTGQMFAIDDVNAATKMWIQLLTGTAPAISTTITGGTSGATIDTSGAATERVIPTPFLGQSTGSAIIGGYGVGVEYADLSASDTLTDLDNVAVNPPNNVTFTVSGLVAGEDRVFVGPWDGVSTDNEGNPAVDADQLTLNTTLNGATETAVVVTTTIPGDTPNSGTIRIELDSGFYRLVSYTSWTSSTFTIGSTDFTSPYSATATNNVYVSYIDQVASSTSASFTGVYSADRSLLIKVRDGGGTPIKEFISSGTLGSAGGSSTAIRTGDT